MNPYIQILGIEFNSMVLFGAFFLIVFITVFWYSARKSLKNDAIYDIAFLSIIFGVFSSRAVAIGEKFFQLWENGPSLTNFDQLPLVFINFFDGNYSFIGFIIGVCGALLLIYINSNKEKNIMYLFDLMLIVLSLTSPLIILGMVLYGINVGEVAESSGLFTLGYPDGSDRYAIYYVQIAYLSIFLGFAAFTLWKKFKNGTITSVFLICTGLGEAFTRLFSNGYNSSLLNTFDLQQVLAIALLFIGVLILTNISGLNILQVSLGKKKEITREEFKEKYYNDFSDVGGNTNNSGGRRSKASVKQGFNVSYADTKKSSVSDKISQKTKTWKRQWENKNS